jgi:hypothetical protein
MGEIILNFNICNCRTYNFRGYILAYISYTLLYEIQYNINLDEITFLENELNL